jgi:membrane dipeptidase
LLTRRDFAKGMGGALALAGISPLLRGDALRADATDAAALCRNAFVLDCNTLASVGQTPVGDQKGLLKNIHESGVTVVKCTLGGAHGKFEETVIDIGALDRLIELWPNDLMKVRVAADMNRAHEEHKLGFIYSFEAEAMLEGKIERIEMFRNLGVRVMQLTYNRRSPFGVGCLDGDTEGLTELGRKAIAKMNELGVAVDLSHSNTQTTREGIAASNKPPIFSHAGCRAVYMHPRNKEDQDMKALADKGGVMGIYMLPFLTASPKQPMLEDYMRHMEYALKVCGEDHVGVGSDVPFEKIGAEDLDAMRKDEDERKAAGISAPGEDRPPYIPDMNTPRKMEIIADALVKRGYSSGAVEKVLGLNFRRVFTEIWTA